MVCHANIISIISSIPWKIHDGYDKIRKYDLKNLSSENNVLMLLPPEFHWFYIKILDLTGLTNKSMLKSKVKWKFPYWQSLLLIYSDFFSIQQNPLTSKSDRHLFSHKNITAELNVKVMRIKDVIITLGRPYVLNKFSWSVPNEMCKEQYWEYANWC